MQEDGLGFAESLSEEIVDNQRKKEFNRTRLSAMNMLSRREQSRKELENKLGARFDQEVVAQVLDELQQQGLQSDDRFVESFVVSRVQRGQGPLKIRYELKNKGINPEAIATKLEVYADEWLELARDLLHRKFGEEPPADHKDRQKRQRFIASRGFPNDICYRVFD